jgi:hypothetical protein
LHQPLHSADNHDKGGNAVKIIVDGFEHNPRDELHAYWDTQFVRARGRSPNTIAQQLIGDITATKKTEWEKGTVDDWAMEAYAIAKSDVYGNPPLSQGELEHLDAAYVAQAEKDVALQLSRAGVRLALVLNRALAAGTAASSIPTSHSAETAPAQTSAAPENHPTNQASDAANQFATEGDAKKHCPSDNVAWANLRSAVYHFAGYPSYGNTKSGAYMCGPDATRQGMHAAKAERRS